MLSKMPGALAPDIHEDTRALIMTGQDTGTIPLFLERKYGTINCEWLRNFVARI